MRDYLPGAVIFAALWLAFTAACWHLVDPARRDLFGAIAAGGLLAGLTCLPAVYLCGLAAGLIYYLAER